MKTKPGDRQNVATANITGSKPLDVQQPMSTVQEFMEKQTLTKQERFRKYAGGRTAQALRAIELIGNCANTQSYEYTPDEVMRMFNQLRQTLTETEAKFQPKQRQKFGRNFFDETGG